MRVAGLFFYPVKSLRGVAVESLTLGPRGPRFDREFMITDPSGKFLTQRVLPAMATLCAVVRDGRLVLEASDGARCDVDLAAEGAPRSVTVWRDTVDAVDAGEDVASWLSAQLGRSCRLVRMPATTRRLLDVRYSPRGDAHTGFADGYPVLITATASLTDLNRRLARSLGMERFRPNVVLETDTPWAEDEWRVLRVGEVVFDLVKPCSRCAVITTDQTTGARPDGSTPLSVLASFRTREPFGACFGENAVHRAEGTLRLGDEATVLEHRARAVTLPEKG